MSVSRAIALGLAGLGVLVAAARGQDADPPERSADTCKPILTDTQGHSFLMAAWKRAAKGVELGFGLERAKEIEPS